MQRDSRRIDNLCCFASGGQSRVQYWARLLLCSGWQPGFSESLGGPSWLTHEGVSLSAGRFFGPGIQCVVGGLSPPTLVAQWAPWWLGVGVDPVGSQECSSFAPWDLGALVPVCIHLSPLPNPRDVRLGCFWSFSEFFLCQTIQALACQSLWCESRLAAFWGFFLKKLLRWWYWCLRDMEKPVPFLRWCPPYHLSFYFL